jgi:hypothetical protein
MEVVIASGILVVIALGISNVIVNSQQGAQSVQKRLDAGQLQSYITQILNNPVLCTQSLGTQSLPVVGEAVPTLKFGNTKIDQTAVNNSFNSGQIAVKSLTYKTVTSLGGGAYAVEIELQVSLAGNGSPVVIGGNTAPPVDFPVIVNVSAGKISSCGGGQSSVQAWANIFCSVPDVCTLQSSYNISGFTATLGIYNIVFQNALPSANYAVLVTANNQHQNASNNVAGGVMGQTALGVQVYTFARDDGHLNNSSLVSIVVIQ